MPCLSILLLFCAFVGNPQTAQACSGGTGVYPVEELSQTDVIVHARVTQVDDTGHNAILHVNRYFKGSGDSYLVMMRQTFGMEVGAGVRAYDVGCSFVTRGDVWIEGSQGYFGLYRNVNGTFTDRATYGGGTPHFLVQDNIVEFYSQGLQALTSTTASEFEQLLFSIAGRSQPLLPDTNINRYWYPLMRFAVLTTQDGTRYRLNPDHSIARLKDNRDPIAISPDGSHIAFRMDTETIGLQYVYLQPISGTILENNEELAQSPLVNIEGSAVQFSPDSNLVAVWDETHLSVYLFDNQQYLGTYIRSPLRVQAVATADIQVISTSQLLQLVWNADSTTVAYADAAGIWRWNIFQEARPARLVPMDVNAPLPVLDVSRSGRYVRYGVSENWILLDTFTGNTYENAIATPDEGNLIYVTREETVDSWNDVESEPRSCVAPLAATCPITLSRAPVTYAFWYRYDQLGLLSCYEQGCYLTSHSWQLAVDYRFSNLHLDYFLPPVRQIAYDELYDAFIFVVDDYTLQLNSARLYGMDERYATTLDLSSQLDSPIAHVEWDQPIFYTKPPVQGYNP